MAAVKTGIWKDSNDHKEKKGIGTPPPSGLVPAGNSGIYVTPNTPADPRDCDRYPSSPYCGGNPFNNKLIDIKPSFTAQIDACGISVSATLNPTLGFIKLPPVSAAYIDPNCRAEYERKKRHEPPPAPPGERDDYTPTPQYSPYGFSPNDIVSVVTIDQYFEENQDYFPESGWCVTRNTLGGSINSIDDPSQKQVPFYNPVISGNNLSNAKLSVDFLDYGSGYANENWVRRYWRQDGNFSASDSTPRSVWIEKDRPTVRDIFRYPDRYNYQLQYHYTLHYPFVYQTAIWIGRFGDIFPNRQISPIINSSSSTNDGVYASKSRVIHERFVVYCNRIFGDPSGSLPPPPLIPKKNCCEDTMGCCQPSSNNKQDNDLAEIKKMLRDLTKRVGVSEYPVPIPEHLNADYNDSGKKSEPKIVKEENLTTLLGRFIKIFDGVVGEWGIGFKVADADPSKPGDQPKFIHAPNMAELSAEMYSHIFDIWIMQYQLLHLHQRHSTESMLGRKVGIQNYYLLEALVDWCGFKRKDITKKIPFLFDIDAEKFEDYLKNKEQEIQIVDFDPDDENSESFPDQMLRLKRMAAIIEATHTKRFNPNEDIAKSVMGILKTVSKNTDRVNKDEIQKEGTEPDFDQWLRDVETGFINKTGQGDINNPYGVPYAQRPRLTKLQQEPEQPTE